MHPAHARLHHWPWKQAQDPHLLCNHTRCCQSPASRLEHTTLQLAQKSDPVLPDRSPVWLEPQSPPPGPLRTYWLVRREVGCKLPQPSDQAVVCEVDVRQLALLGQACGQGPWDGIRGDGPGRAAGLHMPLWKEKGKARCCSESLRGLVKCQGSARVQGIQSMQLQVPRQQTDRGGSKQTEEAEELCGNSVVCGCRTWEWHLARHAAARRAAQGPTNKSACWRDQGLPSLLPALPPSAPPASHPASLYPSSLPPSLRPAPYSLPPPSPAPLRLWDLLPSLSPCKALLLMSSVVR